MAMQSRSGRVPRSGTNNLPPVPTQQHALRTTTNQPASRVNGIPSDSSDGDDGEGDDQRPAKRRKLNLRSKHTNNASTPDRPTATAQSGQPKPPTKVSVAQPHGQLLETVNGVRKALDVREDELLQHGAGAAAKLTLLTKEAVPQKAGTKQEDKRTLRSQDEGPRLKSELAIYFPNYEDIIFDAPKEAEFVTVDTAIYVTDEAPKQPPPALTPTNKNSKTGKPSPLHVRHGSLNGISSPSSPQRTSSNQYNGSPSLNLDFAARTLPEHPEDPLTDDHYLKSHRRAERREKQLRNIEKERAMHEKVQLDRLLAGLQGHDWLKVLGITGITDGEAKRYEAKRDYFIAEVQALVDKFRVWKEQEKRQRVGRESAAVASAREEESEEGSVEPPSSDLNASAAKQLQYETAIAVKSATARPRPGKGKEPLSSTSTPRPQAVAFLPPPPPPPPEIPITSFYAKRHLRDAALGKARHGRNVTAFGHPIPDMEEREFELPADYVTEETLRANARERRRRKRASVADAEASGKS